MQQKESVAVIGKAKEHNLKKKYVKDYVPTPNGDLNYCGKYYISQIPKDERKKTSRIQILYGICCLVLSLIALCIPCNGNQTIYVVIPVEITLVCLVYYISGSLALRNMSKRMEQKDYDKAYQGPIQALTIAMILYVFSLGGQVIGILMKSSKRSSGDIYFGMILFWVLVMSCVVWNRQRKMMHYVTEEKISKQNAD